MHPYGTTGRKTAFRRHRHRGGRSGHDGRGHGGAQRQARAADRKDGEVGPQGPHHRQGTMQRHQRASGRGIRRSGAHQRRIFQGRVLGVQQPGGDQVFRTRGCETQYRTRRPGLSAERQGMGHRQRTAGVLRRKRRQDHLQYACYGDSDPRGPGLRCEIHQQARFRTQGGVRAGDPRHGRRLLSRDRIDGRRLRVRRRPGTYDRAAASFADAARDRACPEPVPRQSPAAQCEGGALRRRRTRARGVRRDRVLRPGHRGRRGAAHEPRCGGCADRRQAREAGPRPETRAYGGGAARTHCP